MNLIEKGFYVLILRNRRIFLCNSIFIVFCFFTSFSYSQKVFKLDKETNQLSSEVPFDQYFYVDIEDPYRAIETFEVWSLFKVDGILQDFKGKSNEFVAGVTELSERILPPSGKKPDGPLKVTYNKKTTRLIVPPLSPNKHFELLLINKFRDEILRKFIKEVLHKFYNSSEDEGITAIVKLGRNIQPKAPGILKLPRTVLGRYWYEEESKKGPGVPVFEPEAKKFLKTLQSNYDNAMLTTNLPGTTVTNLTNTSFNKAANIYKDFDNSFTLFTAFNNIDLNQDFFLGLTSPELGKKADMYDFVLRSNYLENSEKSIKELIKALQRVRTHDVANDNTYKAMIIDLQEVLKKITANKTFIENEIEKIVGLLDSEPNMRYITWVGGTNVVTNLETISKRYIMPTIGLAYIDTEANGPNFVKPFAGVSFHLRAIDKDVPLKELSSNFWHRTTIFVGFTATKLNDDSQQYSDQNSTFSLMTGLNLKLSHAIGFSLGGIVLKRVNPNPTIIKKQNVLSPYFGLTLDVDFAKQLSKLTSKGNL